MEIIRLAVFLQYHRRDFFLSGIEDERIIYDHVGVFHVHRQQH